MVTSVINGSVIDHTFISFEFKIEKDKKIISVIFLFFFALFTLVLLYCYIALSVLILYFYLIEDNSGLQDVSGLSPSLLISLAMNGFSQTPGRLG